MDCFEKGNNRQLGDLFWMLWCYKSIMTLQSCSFKTAGSFTNSNFASMGYTVYTCLKWFEKFQLQNEKSICQILSECPQKSPSPHATKVTFWTSWAYGITRPPQRFEAVWETCPRDVKGCQPWPMPSRWEMEGVAKVEKTWGGCDTVDIQWDTYTYEECPNDVFVTDCFLEVVDRHFLPRGAERYIHICHVPHRYFPVVFS